MQVSDVSYWTGLGHFIDSQGVPGLRTIHCIKYLDEDNVPEISTEVHSKL